ncbi:MAG: hypothetical protein K9N47_28055 [Prosthecobacter sp.]|uniref:hypothetical protein n=1 Tax=Prosthecobacter sp. TaxID=1965333 RepID=UPI0026021C2C|nr:hypothetical protein [Prosthecobacter sp.]MCF7790006.1 hypothetical protein [Prosthecobacter sp.]
MKTTLLFSLLLASATLSHANPEIATVIDQEYGAATAEGILLLQSTASAAEPVQWSVFARDPFRPGELVRASLTLVNGAWAPKATGAGPKLLGRVPPMPIAFNRVRLRSSDVIKIAQRNAMLAKTNFVTASYQLAADAATGAPQWGLALNGTEGREVGFIVISAETGAVIHQQWNNGLASNVPGGPVSAPEPDGKGERAADNVKRAARNAWEWTGDTGLEVGHFFKRLFRSGN